jgi:hypothetical protein
MKTLLVSLLLGLSTLGGGASASMAQQSPAAAAGPRDNSVTVQNNRAVPVTVYMEYGEFDRRLGIVPAQQTATLALPAWAVSDRQMIQLFVHPEGQVEDLSSQDFSLAPPARLGILVPASGNMPEVRTRTMRAVIPPEELADATLTVDNPRDRAVTVYAEQGEFDVRLGAVPAHSRLTLPFPRSVVAADNSVQIFVHPDGGADLSGDVMQVRQGQHLGLRIPAH